MTVTNQTAYTSAVGSGSTGQEVPFSFPIKAATDLLVIVRTTATGAEATKVLTTDYSVTISGDTGGTLTTVTAVAITEEIFIFQRMPRTQTVKLTQGGNFNAENIEDALDRIVMMINSLSERVDKCLQLPETEAGTTVEIDNAVDRASDYFKFDSNGDISMEAS